MSIPSEIQQCYDRKLKSVLNNAGFINVTKVTDTLQGSIWRGSTKKSKNWTVIKVTNKYLHDKSIAFANDKTFHNINENIIMEASILKQLTKHKHSPNSIVKYRGFFESDQDYFLMMQDGGESLFDFVEKAHKLILSGNIDIDEWHKVCRIIFKQMVEAIKYIHDRNVCHFDISLENFLINDVKIHYLESVTDPTCHKIKFIPDDIQIKLCDFGLAGAFDIKSKNCKSNKYVGKAAYKSPEIVSKKKYFDAKANDIWTLGICLFMILFGGIPFKKASNKQESFKHIINGNLFNVLKIWNKTFYVTKEMLDLMNKFFKYENDRITLKEIIQHSWLK